MSAMNAAHSADNSTFRLWCIVGGNSQGSDSQPFQVTVPTNNNIFELKQHIYEEIKNGIPSNINAKDLILWKVSSYHQFLRFALCILMVWLWLTPICLRPRLT